ncbi:MAG: hypothetical protein WCF77_01065 [Minisyncoccia bacterium]|jgi:hypothetical protein
MQSYSEMKPERLRAIGVPVPGLPEVPPERDGHILYALVTNGDSKEFAVAIPAAFMYWPYREMAHHAGDEGNWLFRKTELFFVPAEALAGT